MKTIISIFALLLAISCPAQFGPNASTFWTTNSTPPAGGFYLVTAPGPLTYNIPVEVILTATQTTNAANQAALNVSVTATLASLSTNTLSVSNMYLVQAITFPTNAIPAGSATVTNIAIVNWKGLVRYVATNRASSGYMEQTNGAWYPFTP